MISVLCVDDDPGLLDIEKIFLERGKEFLVETATSGAEALSRLKHNSIDAVVSDYQMPEMDGIELLKKIRMHNGIPFILFTGKGREDVAIDAINNGVDFYLQKGGEPVAQFAELAHKIRQAVKRREVERMLTESEQKFHTFAAFTHDWEYWQAPDNHFVYISPACEHTTGYTVEEFEKNLDLINTIVHPDDRGLWENHQVQLLSPNSVSSIEFRIIRKDGTVRWISHRCQMIRDPDFTPRGLRVGNTDITERKRMEDALRQSEENYRTIVETTNEGILALDDQFFITFVNLQMTNLLGYTSDELLGRPITDFMFEETLSDHKEQVQARRNGKSSVYERSLRQKGGSAIWCRVSATPLNDELGVFKGSFAMFADITERKRAEVALAENTRMLDTLMNNLPGMVYRCHNDPDWTTEFASGGSLDLTGYTPEDLINNQTVSFGSLIVPEDRETVFQYVQQGVDGQSPFQMDYRIADKSGNIRWVHERGRGIFNARNELVTLEGFIFDITERKQAETALDESESRLRSFIETTRDSIVIIDEEGNVIEWNTGAERLTGIQQKEALGMSFLDLTLRLVIPESSTAECCALTEERFRNSLKTGVPIFEGTRVVEIERPDGTRVFTRQTISPIKTGKGFRFSSVAQDITDEILAEKAVKESGERFRSLIEKSPIAIDVMREGKHFYINSMLTRMFGYGNPEEIYQNPIISLFSPEVRPEIEERIRRRSLGLTELTDYETVGLRKDGTQFPLHVTAATIHLADGDATLGFLTDITERRRAEDALRQSEERFRLIFEQGPLGMALLDVTHRFDRVNPSFCAMLGYSEDEMRTKTVSDITHPDHLATNLEFIQQLTRGEISQYCTEKRYIGKTGQVIWGDISVVAIRNGDGKIRNFLAMITNITSRKNMEIALQKSEAKYRVLVENANTIIMRIDKDAKFTYLNEFAQNFFGYPEQELIGQPILKTILPESESVTGRDMKFIVHDMVVNPEQYSTHECECVKKNGDLVWISCKNKPILDEQGTVIGLSCIATDITDRRNAEAALIRVNKKLNLLNSITRHDLLNQLMPLSGYLELIRDSVSEDERHTYIERQQKALKNLQHIISFTKDYQDIGLFRPQWQNPGNFVRQIIRTLDLRNVAVVNDLGTLEIFADPLLEKVIYNLLDNAIRHGGTLKTIRVSYLMSDPGCTIVCEDDGEGVPKDSKEKIFERGYGKNTGFGLFLAREILGITGFTIRETGTSGSGARFEICVPKGSFRVS